LAQFQRSAILSQHYQGAFTLQYCYSRTRLIAKKSLAPERLQLSGFYSVYWIFHRFLMGLILPVRTTCARG
jgi:hypothetical protein